MRVNAGETALESHDLLNDANTWSAIQTHGARIDPDTDNAHDLGTTTARWQNVCATIGMFFGNDADAVTLPVSANHGGLIAGRAAGAGTKTVTLNGTYGPVAILGNCVANHSTSIATLTNPAGGAVLIGSAYTFGNAAHSCIISIGNLGFSSLCGGYTYCFSNTAATALVTCNASGALVWVYATSSNGGSSTGRATNIADGSFVQGFVSTATASGVGLLESLAGGQFVQGYISTSGTGTIQGGIGAFGAFAHGAITSGAGGSIIASGLGSLSAGSARNAFTITASADGSLAFGATGGDGSIQATAANAFQFGPADGAGATNSQARSLQVGDDMRMTSGGAPTTPHNGDQWVSTTTNYQIARGNGVSVELVPESQAVNEVFYQDNVAASQTAVALGVRNRVTFSDVMMVRAGSIIGLNVRLSEAVTAGTLTCTVAVNGTAGTLNVALTAGTNGQAVQLPGTDTFIAGDTVSIEITTTGTFTPTTTDVEAWLEIATQ